MQLVDKAITITMKECQEKSPFDVVRLDGVYCFSLQDSVKELCSQIIDDDDGDVDDKFGFSDTMPFDGNL